jgi:hypothetical protein
VSFAFDSHQGLIVVNAEIWGPSGSAVLSLALDTGATFTLLIRVALCNSGTIRPLLQSVSSVHRKRSRVRAPADRHKDRSFGARAKRLFCLMSHATSERESRWVTRVGLLSRAKLKY